MEAAKYFHSVVALLMLLFPTTMLGSTPQPALTRCPSMVTYDAERRDTMCCYPCSDQAHHDMELQSPPGGDVSCPAYPKLESVIGEACSIKDDSSHDSHPPVSDFADFPLDKEGKLAGDLHKVDGFRVHYRDIEIGKDTKIVKLNHGEVIVEYFAYDKDHKRVPIGKPRNKIDLCKHHDNYSGTGIKEGIEGMREGGKRWIVLPRKGTNGEDYVALHVKVIEIDHSHCFFKGTFL